MRKNMVLGMGIGAILGLGGCVAVNKGTLNASHTRHQAVGMDGKIYVVDLHTGEVARIEQDAIVRAKPFVGIPEEDWNVRVDKD